ncbi:MAG: ABC transporter substrate-binding protein [Defluviitaleaceae bacterium]|nr:ABC transporter substrate-binding protein [Defluviitaleaceae bacterium]MCL2239365.1 ABC transporter substrate-binding protein [Defluviitaleaceae bacterium]
MKKILFLVLLLAAAMFALAACRGGGNGGDGPVATPTPVVTPPPALTPADPPPPPPAPPGTREYILARAAAMTPAPGSYIVNATITRPDSNMLSSAWSNPAPNAQARVMMGGISTMGRNHVNDFFPNPLVMVDGAWPEITDLPNGDRRYTFTIYTDLVFSDGTPITAYHFGGGLAFAISYQWTSIVPSNFVLPHMAYRGPFLAGEIDVLPSVRIYNERQFSLTKLAEYLPNFWEASANMNVGPSPLHMYGIEAHDNGDGVFLTAIGGGPFTVDALRERVLGGVETFVQHLDPDGNPMYDSDGNPTGEYFTDGLKFRPTVVSGPYMFDSVDVGNGVLTMVANPNFPGTWDGYRPRIERVIWRMTPAPIMVDALATGLAHVAENVNDGTTIGDALDVLVGGGTHTFITYAQNGQLFTQFHVDTGPTQFVEVRQALSFLQDRHAMNEEVGRGFTAVAHGPWSEAWWWHQEAVDRGLYDRVTIYSLNIARAIELLEQGGWNYNADGSAFVQGVDELRHKWVDEWDWGRDEDGEIERIYREGGVAIRSNKVYTGERVLMPLIINWMVRAVDYPFRDALERTFFDNVAYAGGLVIQERSALWSGALSSGYAFAGGRFEMHTLGVTMAITWSPWIQARLDAIPAQNWHQADSPRWRDLAHNIMIQDITTPEGREGFIAAYIDYMEYRTYHAFTLPFNSAVVHDFIPVGLGGWFNTALWAFPEAIQRAYWR